MRCHASMSEFLRHSNTLNNTRVNFRRQILPMQLLHNVLLLRMPITIHCVHDNNSCITAFGRLKEALACCVLKVSQYVNDNVKWLSVGVTAHLGQSPKFRPAFPHSTTKSGFWWELLKCLLVFIIHVYIYGGGVLDCLEHFLFSN